MSFAGATFQPSSSIRGAPLISTPPAPVDNTTPFMRRGLPLLQRLVLPCQLCWGSTPLTPSRPHVLVGLVPRAYGVKPKSEGPQAVSVGLPYEPLDRALVNAKRNAEEARRLKRDYESISAAQLRRARQAALGPAGAEKAGALGLPSGPPQPLLPPVPLPGLESGGFPGSLRQTTHSLLLQQQQQVYQYPQQHLLVPQPMHCQHQVQQPPVMAQHQQHQQQEQLPPHRPHSFHHQQHQQPNQATGLAFTEASESLGAPPPPPQEHQPSALSHQYQQSLARQPDGRRQLSTIAPKPDVGGPYCDADLGAATQTGYNGSSASYSQLQEQQALRVEGWHYHHHHHPQQQQQQRQQQAVELSEALLSVLWDGHVRIPEQTSWAEASTSAGGDDAKTAIRGLLGSRRLRATARANALAMARRMHLEATQRKALVYGTTRVEVAASPLPPPPAPLTLAVNDQSQGNGSGNDDFAVDVLVAESLLAPGRLTCDGADLKGPLVTSEPRLSTPPYTAREVPHPAQDLQLATPAVVVEAAAGDAMVSETETTVQQQQQQQQQQQDTNLEEQAVNDLTPAVPNKKTRKTRAKKHDPEAGQVYPINESDAVSDIDPGNFDLSGAVASVASSPKRTRRKRSPSSPPSPSEALAAVDGVTASSSSSAAAAVAMLSQAAAIVVPSPLPPPVEDVKLYLQEGLRPFWPPVPVPEYDGYFIACEGFCTKQPLMNVEPSDVLIVDTPEVARAVVDKLLAAASRPYPSDRSNPPVPCRYFGCDTEVAFIDVTSETPIGHGAVLCLSIYGGDDLDFSDCERAAAGAAALAASAPLAHGSVGAGSLPAVHKDRIWVNVWGEVELDAKGEPIMDGRYVRLKPHHPILDEFKRFFEDDSVKKVWHNYGFDRHVLENMGICCHGFGGDTLHMARLADASRSGKRTYGLDSLTSDPNIMRHFSPNKAGKPPRELTGNARRAARMASTTALMSMSPPALVLPPSMPGVGTSPGDKRAAEVAKLVRAKISMKDRFGLIKIRNGVPGKVPELPAMQQLHTLELFRPTWIDYSALDAKATWQLREALEGLLRLEPWEPEPSLAQRLGYGQDPAAEPKSYLHLWHFYCSYWLDFGELLTEMERRGMMVNRQHLAEAQQRAEVDKAAAMREFLEWADSKVPGARYMNAHSGMQIRMLLFPDFPGYASKAAAALALKEKSATQRAAKKAATAAAGGGGAPPPGMALTPTEAVVAEAAGAGSTSGNGGGGGGDGNAIATAEKSDTLPSGSRIIKVANPRYAEELAQGKRVSKYMNLELHGIWGKGEPGRLQPEILTATNAAAVSIKVLRGLAGKPGAARKELAKLLEARAAAAADSRAAVAAARAAEAAARVPIVEDVLDEAMQELAGSEENGGSGNRVEAEEEEAVEAEEGEESREGAARLGPVPMVDDPVLMAALEKEAKETGLGRLYAACGGGEEGLRACIAVEALCEISAIDKLLSAFIIPLQSDDTSTTTRLPAAPGSESPTRAVHRVHCSLNINTETGRLSARRPNLQNQPALEKDRYKVRRAFTADTESGNTLVVADYGQLELRILAHMTNCASMKEAFELGGDFHSRTAYGMYDYIQEAVRNGECYLEWEGEGEPDKPLVKDKYASERRKAKVLNFSIAYGKTAHGLAADFKTTKEEAQETVNKWYSDRWEVRKWQEDMRKSASEEGKVRTLLGRTRPLPNINSPDFRLSGHSNRAAINTPIQGSAADVAAAAMVAIHKSDALRATGFKLLMQIHDEVILEGPRDRSEDAKRLVMALMANPWAELSRHWNAMGASGLMQGPDWRRLSPQQPGGHVAGVWRHGGEVGGASHHQHQHHNVARGAGEHGGAGEGQDANGGGEVSSKTKSAMPLLVELATDCNVADTWYEAK